MGGFPFMVLRTGRRLLWLSILLWAIPSAAQEEPRAERYRVRPAVDVPVLVLAGTAWAAPRFFLDDLVDPTCPCDASDVPGLDRWSIDHHSDGLDLASDVTLGAVVAASLLLEALAADGSPEGWRRFGEDAVVMGESVLVSGALTQLTKLLVQRPRPHLYNRSPDDPEIQAEENYLSFPSSHVSTVFALGLSAARTYRLHHPESRHVPVVYGTAIGVGVTMGVVRILAGRHFTSDVLAGAAIGSAAGVVIPWLHTRSDGARVGFSGSPEAGLVVRVTIEGGNDDYDRGSSGIR